MEDFDLNLVRTFVRLYETRSVTVTAESLHVSQPTVSYNLRKLRRRFDDELFRRTGQGLLPTSLAQRLYQPLHGALSEIDAVVSRTESFDPGTASARFTLCLSDLGEATLLPRLMAALRVRAPGVSLTVRPLDVARVEQQLGRSEIDAFIATPLITSERMARTPLFTEKYVGMVAVDHPRIRASEVSVPELAEERHATVFGPSGHVGPRATLKAYGLLSRIALEVTRFSVLPYLVQRTDLVAIVPEYVAEVFAAEHRVRLLSLPFEIEPIEVAVYARHAQSRSSAQHWLVGFLSEVLGEQVSSAQSPPRQDRGAQQDRSGT